MLAQSLESFSASIDDAFKSSDFHDALSAISVTDLVRISDIDDIESSAMKQVVGRIADCASRKYRNVVSFLEKTDKLDSFKQLERHYSKYFDDAKLIPESVKENPIPTLKSLILMILELHKILSMPFPIMLRTCEIIPHQ